MDRYLVKYTVNFPDHNIALEEEMEVDTDDPEIAKAYVKSLYDDDECNVVEIPQSILDRQSGYGKTDLFFDSVHLQHSWPPIFVSKNPIAKTEKLVGLAYMYPDPPGGPCVGVG